MKVLLTGGGACGKSSFAEQLISRLPKPYYYIATMQPYGADGAAKVAKHRKMREGRGFVTIEQYRDVQNIRFKKPGTVLFEDIVNLAANEMFDETGQVRSADEVGAVVSQALAAVIGRSRDIVIVTNEIGSDLQDYSPETRSYIKLVGLLNQAAAACCDYVYEFVCGIPLCLKAPEGGTTADEVSLAMNLAHEAEEAWS